MILDKIRILGRRTHTAATLTIPAELGQLATTVWIWLDGDRHLCVFLATESRVHGARLVGSDPHADLVDFLDEHELAQAEPDEFARVLFGLRHDLDMPTPWIRTRIRVSGRAPLLVVQDLADDQLADA
jgi:hypothetical protein